MSSVRNQFKKFMIWSFPRGCWQYDLAVIGSLVLLFTVPLVLPILKDRPPGQEGNNEPGKISRIDDGIYLIVAEGNPHASAERLKAVFKNAHPDDWNAHRVIVLDSGDTVLGLLCIRKDRTPGETE
ncbi:hypothetical protein ACFLU6_03630 [Acidobacteriota bacterium]